MDVYGGGGYGGGAYGDDMMMGAGGDSFDESSPPGASGMRRSSGFSASSRRSTPQTGPKSTLTLQATKAQVDAFAQGKMTPDDFLKSVNVIRY